MQAPISNPKKSKSSKKRTDIAQRLLLGFSSILLFLSPVILAKTQKNKAQHWFEYAYRIEKVSPKEAMRMYQWSLEAGLKKGSNQKSLDLAKIAFWRLFYLYKERGLYLEAVLFAKEMHKNLVSSKKFQKLIERTLEESQQAWSLSQESLYQLLQGVLAISTKKDAARHFIKAIAFAAILEKGNSIKHSSVKQAILQLYIKKQLYSQGLAFLVKLRENLSQNNHLAQYHLDSATIQIEAEDYSYANRSLDKVIHSELRLNAAEQAQLYYLMGRIQQGRKRYLQAANYFKMAASLSQQKRMLALAAQCLYFGDNIIKASQLIANQSFSSYSDEKILQLVLKFRTSRGRSQKKILSRLKGLAPYIRAKNAHTKSILAKHALAIIQ